MSSSLNPTNYLQQQGTNNTTTSNPSSPNNVNNNTSRPLDHSRQNQNQNQNQQSYYYQSGDYSHHPRQQQQQQQQQQGFPRHPGGLYPQPQQLQQSQRPEDHYRQDHSPPIMTQGKPQQQQQQQQQHQQQQYHQQYQPQYQSQQYPPHPQQRNLALNNPCQQQQQQRPNRGLLSPSISLTSDEYQAQRDYSSGGDASVSVSSSTGQNQQEQSEQASASVSGASESVEDSFSPRFEGESSLRFKITLDAQTAAMQHQGDTPVTYLNKGQFYTITIHDTEEYDGDIHSVIRVTFHEEPHRKLAARYWNFWLSQQTNPKTARALDIEKASSTGMMEVQSKTFDRISFRWNGKAGAKLMARFNCLSTDFSRIKGVKGIPLRAHMDTSLNGASLDKGNQQVERSYAKIKLFRDKGAERKNKDDQKHLEKMWDKMRGKNADTNPLSQVLAPVQNVSLFWECLDHQEDSAEDETLDLSETLAQEPIGSDSNAEGEGTDSASGLLTAGEDVLGVDSPGDSNALVPTSRKRRRLNDVGGGGTSGGTLSGSLYSVDGPGSSEQLLDKDPSYVPQMRKKKQSVLCLYIKIGGEAVYRAVYLERLTLEELTQKLSEKLEIQSSTISGVYRKTTKKELMVRVDDSMVAQMTDELDVVVEYDFNQQDGSVNLTLRY